MDLWTDEKAPVKRIKVEPELNINDDWVTYPIEARVMEARIPPASSALPTANLEPAFWMRAFVCGLPTYVSGNSALFRHGPSPAGLRLRNSQQDVRLMEAHTAAKEESRSCWAGVMRRVPPDPEWYLRIRDYLFRLR